VGVSCPGLRQYFGSGVGLLMAMLGSRDAIDIEEGPADDRPAEPHRGRLPPRAPIRNTQLTTSSKSARRGVSRVHVRAVRNAGATAAPRPHDRLAVAAAGWSSGGSRGSSSLTLSPDM
jgi:hypothetical protein